MGGALFSHVPHIRIDNENGVHANHIAIFYVSVNATRNYSNHLQIKSFYNNDSSLSNACLPRLRLYDSNLPLVLAKQFFLTPLFRLAPITWKWRLLKRVQSKNLGGNYQLEL